MQCPRCQQDNAPTKKFCGECGAPLRVVNPSDHPLLSYGEVTSALRESLAQHTATAEILRAIGQSPPDIQPIFQTIAERAAVLCDVEISTVTRFDGESIDVAALYNVNPAATEVLRRLFPARPSGASASARAIRDRVVVHIPDVLMDREYEIHDAAVVAGIRAALAVPMLHGERAIGTVAIARRSAGRFSDNQIALLQTFAAQAVIAIENVRLFKELEERNQALTEALEQQTATSEILSIISRSPTEVGPVFETIVRRAALLCDAARGGLVLIEGDRLCVASAYPQTPESVELMRRHYPRPVDTTSLIGHAILERRVVHVPDLESPDVKPLVISATRQLGFRSYLTVPMFRDGQPIGAIAVSRLKPGAFSDNQIELLKTFAAQAVIAIENVRLFTELQGKNQALTTAHAQVTEALDQQTATSEILRVISSSPGDAQPVFDAMVQSARRLCDAAYSAVYRLDGDVVYLVAHNHHKPEAVGEMARAWPMPLTSTEGVVVWAIREQTAVHTADVQADLSSLHGATLSRARALDLRSMLVIPMVREGQPIGAIRVSRTEPTLFSDKQVELLRTFADQAVIAIENVRLFKELEARTQDLTRSVDELRALGEVGQAVSSTLNVDTVLTTIVSRAVQLSRSDGGSIYEYDDATEEFTLRAAHNLHAPDIELRRAIRLRKGEGATGRMAITHEPVQLPDISSEGAYDSRLREALLRTGARAVLAVPLLREDHFIGSLVVSRNTPGLFPTGTVELLKTFATQSALAIQNARLFREIEEKSRQLEVASQHKSEFLANMSHELRTPLNSIIGFSEVLSDRLFGELNEKQEEYLKDIYASGTHLLSLINDILDLSKIEAGRMELELTDFDLPTALDNALMLVRERAQRRSLALHKDVDAGVGQIRGDERKIRQVVLNLLSNAIKFTPDGGRIEVSAMPKDGLVEVSVTDTGVGIAPEDQEKVFEEFRQVGTAEKKAEGTGLGLTLCRKFIELHGGRIWVKSQVGAGSAFTFTIPVLRGE